MKKVLMLIIMTAAVFADMTGSIIGSVSSRNTSEPLIGANIMIVGELKGAATDLDGNYVIEKIPVGSYDVQASMVGYKSIVRNRVIVQAGRPTVLNFSLEIDISETERILVRPSYFETAKDAAVSSKSMDFQEIATQPGAVFDVQRAVQALPSVVSSADQDNEIIVRGGNYGENLFMIDNIEIANPNHFGWIGTGGGAITAIYMDFVESVDFIAGAFPAKYGDKASSVLDIKLREGLRDRFHFKFDIGMAGAGGNIEGPIFDGKGSYMLAYHRSFLDLIASSWGMTAVPQYWNTQGKLNYDFSPRLKLNVFSMYAKDWITVDSREEEYMEEDDEFWLYESMTNQYTVGANLKRVYNKGFGMLTLFANSNHWDEVLSDTTTTDIWRSNKTTESTYSIKLDGVYIPFDKNELSAGLYGKYNTFDYNFFDDFDTVYYYYPGTDSIIGSTGIVHGIDTSAEFNSIKLGGYLQYRHNFGSSFYTVSGLRFDYFNFNSSSYLSPRLSATYLFTPNTDLSLAYGRHYQPAPWFMLAFNGKDHPLDYYYADQIVLGLGHLFADNIRGTVEIYNKRYHDYPIQRSATTPDPLDREYFYVNQVEGYARGIELFLQKKVKENFWGTASYSYSIARNKDPRRRSCPDLDDCIYGEYPKPFDYGHVATGIIGYRREFMNDDWYRRTKEKPWWGFVSWVPGMPSDASEYSLRFRYLGERPISEPTYHDTLRMWTIEPDQEHMTGRIPAYSALDLHLQSRWYSGKFTVFSYFELTNILNRKNIWYYQYNSNGRIDTIYQRGRMFVGGLIIEF